MNSKFKMQNANAKRKCLHFAFCTLHCLCILIVSGCSGSLDFDRMREQKRTDAYATSMRTPPRGTVAVTDRDISVADVSIERGRHVFDIYCAVCHSENAAAPSVMAANMPGPPPPSLTTGEAAQRSPAEMLEIVSHGKNRMPAFDWALPAEDRWAVVAYVKSR